MMVEVCGLRQYCFGFTIYLGCQLQRDENEMAKKLLFGQCGFYTLPSQHFPSYYITFFFIYIHSFFGILLFLTHSFQSKIVELIYPRRARLTYSMSSHWWPCCTEENRQFLLAVASES
jgi:hypothetical protein